MIFIGNASQPFGHCCFNGCGNTCLQITPKCKTETVTECKEIEIPPVEKCEPAICPYAACGATHNEICIMSNITSITQQCTEKCKVETENVCEDKISQQCKEESIQICKECKKIPQVTTVCREKIVKDCKLVEKWVDKTVTKEVCENKCTDVISNDCKQVPDKECKEVPEEITKEIERTYCLMNWVWTEVLG